MAQVCNSLNDFGLSGRRFDVLKSRYALSTSLVMIVRWLLGLQYIVSGDPKLSRIREFDVQ